MVTKREGTTNRRGFLANGLSLAGAPVNLSILCDAPEGPRITPTRSSLAHMTN